MLHYTYNMFGLPRKINILSASLATLTLSGVAVFFPFLVSAQTIPGQINDVRQQINELQQTIIQQENTTSQNKIGSSTNISLLVENSLSIGDEGPAVLQLQKALNDVPGILVSTTGPGSPGQETSYFGSKTKIAVEKLQAKYAQDILVPAGLNSPTGFFGAQTRQKLVQLLSKRQIKEQSPLETTSSSSVRNTEASPNSDSQQPASDPKNKEMSELRDQFSITKWSFTKEEKQRIYDMMPPEIQEKHFSDFLENTTESNNNEDSTETPTNPLQDRYQQLQNSNNTSLKKWVKGQLALRNLFKPLGLLRKNLTDVFGAEIAHAQGFFVFGGRIASVEPCPTPPNALQVTVVGPRPGRFALIPGASQLRPVVAGVPRPGMNTLGSYIPVPGCYGPPPALAPLTQGTIIQMGVSQI